MLFINIEITRSLVSIEQKNDILNVSEWKWLWNTATSSKITLISFSGRNKLFYKYLENLLLRFHWNNEHLFDNITYQFLFLGIFRQDNREFRVIFVNDSSNFRFRDTLRRERYTRNQNLRSIKYTGEGKRLRLLLTFYFCQI